MDIIGQIKITGVFGDPVIHSLSPAMHNAAYRKLNLPYVYTFFHVTSENLTAAVQAIRALNIAGINVTVPHKEAIIPHLDVLDESAKRCGAVNTVLNNNGTLIGHNTDGVGFIASLRENGFNPRGKKAVILGAGGSARAIAAALLDNGAEITIINRTVEKAKSVADALNSPRKVKVLPLIPKATPEVHGTHLVINSLSTPFRQNGSWLLDLSPAQGALFYDLRYGSMASDFLDCAAAIKSPGLDGLGMLLHQGARAFELFTGQEAPVDVMRESLQTITN